MHIDKYIVKAFVAVSRLIHSSRSLTLVTGANAPYYESMKNNLLRSILQHEADVHVVVWDLGLTPEQLSDLYAYATHFRHLRIQHYPVETLPAMYAMENRNYAFKSYCVYHALKDCQTELLLWLDAGCALTRPLHAERNVIARYGFYSPYSSTSNAELTYPSVMDAYLDGYTQMGKQPMLASGCVGVSTRHRRGVSIIVHWHHAASLPAILAPEGSHKGNHRQDQSVLSLVYYGFYDASPLLTRRWMNVRYHLNKNK